MIGCRYDTIPINPAVMAFDEMLAGSFADQDVDITEENIQSRIRGVTLMALSNKFGPMLLTTGNKSEMSVGYATIYGDMAGGYNPLKDAYKMTVFAISRWRNSITAAHRAWPRWPGDARRHHHPAAQSPNCAPTRRTRIRCRPIRCSTISCWAGRTRKERRPARPEGFDPREPWSSGSSACCTSPNTSGGRPRRG
jgi:hypothetical protein